VEASVIRDFVAGVLWGGVVAGVGLGVISQVAPLRPATGGATGAEVQAVTAPPAAQTPDAAPAKAASGAEPAPKGDTTKAADEAAKTEAAPVLAAPVLPEPVTPKPEAPKADAATPAVPATEGGSPVIGAAAETPKADQTDAAPVADPAPKAPKPEAVAVEKAAPVEEAPKLGAAAEAPAAESESAVGV
jgi:uncharacterized protein